MHKLDSMRKPENRTSCIVPTTQALTFVLSVVLPIQPALAEDAKLRIGVSFSQERLAAPLDGRMLLLISKDGAKEPRFQINDGPKCQQVFGIDVDALRPGVDAAFDGSVFG